MFYWELVYSSTLWSCTTFHWEVVSHSNTIHAVMYHTQRSEIWKCYIVFVYITSYQMEALIVEDFQPYFKWLWYTEEHSYYMCAKMQLYLYCDIIVIFDIVIIYLIYHPALLLHSEYSSFFTFTPCPCLSNHLTSVWIWYCCNFSGSAAVASIRNWPFNNQ